MSLKTIVFAGALAGLTGASAGAGDRAALVLDGGSAGRVEVPEGGIARAFWTEGETSVTLTFFLAPEDAEAFHRISAARVGQPVAIVICGREIIAPVVQAPIAGGAGQVTLPDRATARRYARALRGEGRCPAE